MITWLRLALAWVSFSAAVSPGQSSDEDEPIVGHVDGDILIGYVDRKPTGKSMIQNQLAFRAAVTNTSLWPKNASVGYVMHVQQQTDENLNKLIGILSTYPKLVAVVGLRSAIAAIQTASFVSTIKVPSFTFSNGITMDKILNIANTDYMTPITSTKTRQINATIPSILDKLGVNIVSIAYGPGKDAEFGEMTKILDLGKNRVNVEFHFYLDGSNDSNTVFEEHVFEDTMGHEHTGATWMHTIVLLLQGPQLENILDNYANRKEGPPSNVMFLTDSSGCRNTRRFLSAIKKLTANNVFIFRLCQTYFEVPEVMDYIKNYQLYTHSHEGEIQFSSKVLDSWYREKIGEPCIAGEVGSDCKSIADIILDHDNDVSRYNSRIYYTVRKIVKSLEHITKEQATEVANRNFQDLVIGGSSIGDMLRRGFLENNVPLPEGTTFLRYSNGVMEDDYEVIFDAKDLDKSKTAVWTSGADNQKFINFMEDVKLHISDRTELHLPCSSQCSPGSRTVLDQRFLNCWTCVRCVGNTYTSNGSWASCKECDSNTTFLWANDNRTVCDQPSRSVNLRTTSGKAVWGIICINICILIFTVGVYIKYWKSRVIISSGRDLSSIMFVGILVGHIEAMFIAMEPSTQTCTTIHILGHVFMMLTVCPLLVKTFRIWLIFKFSIKLGTKIKDYVTTWVTMSECAVLILLQLIFLLLGLFLDDSNGFKFVTNYVEESLDTPIVVTKFCGPKSFTLMLASIIYTGLLLLLSTVLGWDCRKLPDNFKESMHIFLSSLISLLLITVYVPAMLTMAGFIQVSLLAGVISIISVTLNLVIFIPKVYVVLFVVHPIKHKDTFKSSTRRSPNEHSDHQMVD